MGTMFAKIERTAEFEIEIYFKADQENESRNRIIETIVSPSRVA